MGFGAEASPSAQPLGTTLFLHIFTSARFVPSRHSPRHDHWIASFPLQGVGTTPAEVITSAQASAHFFLASFSSFGAQGVGIEVLASAQASAGFCLSLYSENLTLFLFEFDLPVNYEVVALEDIYKSNTHGSSNSKRSLRYDHFREVAHV